MRSISLRVDEGTELTCLMLREHALAHLKFQRGMGKCQPERRTKYDQRGRERESRVRAHAKLRRTTE